MEFKLNDEQRQYQQLARDFAGKEIEPETHRLDQSGAFPTEIYAKAWEIGLMNVMLPEELGGLGLKVFEACLIAEEIAAACAGVNAAFEANNLAVAPLVVAGSDEQKARFLTPFNDELTFAAYCGSSGLKGASQDGEDFVLTGDIPRVVNAGVAKWFVALAQTGEKEDAPEFSLFAVPADSPGLVVGEQQKDLGLRAACMRDVSFREVRLTREHLIGNQGEGSTLAERALCLNRPLMAQSSIGLARSALKHSVTYAKERTTFGVPIAKHQAVSFMLADMAKDIEAARLMSWQAASLADLDKPCRTESLMAVAFARDMAMKAATDAVQIFGGYGYSKEYPVEKLMRDAKVLQVSEETSQKQKVKVARQLIGIA